MPDMRRRGISAERRASSGDNHHDVGEKLRTLRKAHRLSLQEMADKSNISIGQISQIERGRSSPSVRTLVSLCSALGLTIGALFNDAPENNPTEAKWIVRLGNRRGLRGGSRTYRKFLLSPDLDGDHQIYQVEFDPMTSSGDEAHNYSGDSSGVLMEGNLELQIDDETFLLRPGDAFRIPPAAKRLYRNPGTQTAKIIWFISVPRSAKKGTALVRSKKINGVAPRRAKLSKKAVTRRSLRAL